MLKLQKRKYKNLLMPGHYSLPRLHMIKLRVHTIKLIPVLFIIISNAQILLNHAPFGTKMCCQTVQNSGSQSRQFWLVMSFSFRLVLVPVLMLKTVINFDHPILQYGSSVRKVCHCVFLFRYATPIPCPQETVAMPTQTVFLTATYIQAQKASQAQKPMSVAF